MVSSSATDLAVARERIRGLEERLKDSSAIDLAIARERVRGLEQLQKEMKEERSKCEKRVAEVRSKAERAVAEERRRGEEKFRTLFERKFFPAGSNDARGLPDPRRSVSG